MPDSAFRFIVGAAVRGERTGADGRVLLRALPAGPAVDVETQLSSLPDFALRPARSGDRLTLRPGEIRRLPIPLHPTGSIEAQVVLMASDARTPLSGVPVVLLDADGREIARSISDFEGYALFEGIAFGNWKVEAGGQSSPSLILSKAEPDTQARILLSSVTP